MVSEQCKKCKYREIVAPCRKNLVSSIISDTVRVTGITLVLEVKYVLLFYMWTPEVITCVRSECRKLKHQLVGYGFTPMFRTKEVFSISDVKYTIMQILGQKQRKRLPSMELY